MGRLTYHVENTGERAGVSRTFSRTATYDRTGLVTAIPTRGKNIWGFKDVRSQSTGGDTTLKT